ncbi:MAG: phosphocholine cytidylyltransferase family protein [archaeon]
MKAIIIAAGPCKRLRPLTDDLPKCMLHINGKPILQNTLELLREKGIRDISVIRGYKKEKINFPSITYFENTDFWNNNILHSLLFARPKLEEANEKREHVIVSYSDIWYDASVLNALWEKEGDIVSTIDINWLQHYDGRTNHPLQEAEKVILDENDNIVRIGKHILLEELPENRHGEFIGLWKFSPQGIHIFLRHFDRVHALLKMTDPHQHASEWQKSYITDMFQELIDQGERLDCARIKENWAEFDTVQDFMLANGTNR